MGEGGDRGEDQAGWRPSRTNRERARDATIKREAKERCGSTRGRAFVASSDLDVGAESRGDGEEEEDEADGLGENGRVGDREDDGDLALRVDLGEEGHMINERGKSPGRAHHVHEVPVLPPEAVEWAKVVLLARLEVGDDGGVRTAFMDDMEAIVHAVRGESSPYLSCIVSAGHAGVWRPEPARRPKSSNNNGRTLQGSQ